MLDTIVLFGVIRGAGGPRFPVGKQKKYAAAKNKDVGHNPIVCGGGGENKRVYRRKKKDVGHDHIVWSDGVARGAGGQ